MFAIELRSQIASKLTHLHDYLIADLTTGH